MNRSSGMLLVVALGAVLSADRVYGQTSSSKNAMASFSGVQEDSETSMRSRVEHPAVAGSTPHDALAMSTFLRTPTSSKKTPVVAPAIHDCVRIVKPINLVSDRFAHRAILFEEPLHERHGIADRRPVKQLAKSTVAFFGRSLLYPSTLITKKHLKRDSGEGWRESQGDQVRPE